MRPSPIQLLRGASLSPFFCPPIIRSVLPCQGLLHAPWRLAGAPTRYATWSEPPPASDSEEPFIMATATTSLRVSLPSPRGGLRHHMPSPVSPRLRPHKLRLPDARQHDPYHAVIRAARVYCSGELLSAVQMSGLFEDSKEFVDMTMRRDPEEIMQAFHDLSPSQRKDPAVLRAFLEDHFHPPGSDLVPHVPHDHTDRPRLLDALEGHKPYQVWAGALNEFWKELCRRVADDVHENQQRYSILRKAAPFIIPGGRFRESYYWDSYWIVLGLLACDMKDTAKGLVSNLLDDVSAFGFVPNGGRLYYLNRSQPPLLSDMVFALVENDPHHIDERWLAEALQVLGLEYAFWMKDGERAVTLLDAERGESHVLNRYWTRAATPRPESFREDLHNAMQAGFYADIAAGAESGWDFSSRWIQRTNHTGAKGGDGGDHYPLHRIATTSILPVDLNSFMYRFERNMARMHEFLHQRQTGHHAPSLPSDSTVEWESAMAQRYADASDRRALAMDRFLWSDADGMWKDHWLSNTRHQTPPEVVLSSSNFTPLWARVLHNRSLSSVSAQHRVKAFFALKNSGLIEVGGVRTTTTETEEQWDSPNAWSPVVHMTIEGLEAVGCPEASDLAQQIARDWLASNHLGWANTGQMFEKYNAALSGARGEGGEYYPQVGFGWTNGVVLHLLKTYAHRL